MQLSGLERQLAALEKNRHVLWDDFLSPEECRRVTNHFMQETEKLRLSAIGRAHEKKQITAVRNSELRWLEPEDFRQTTGLQNIQLAMTHLQECLACYFRIALKRFEAQFSYYPPGGFYKKHIDQHADTRHRIFTCVLYLNDLMHSGELVLYKPESRKETDRVIAPKAGRLALFFSGEVFHKVRKTDSDRFALNFWLRDDELLPML